MFYRTEWVYSMLNRNWCNQIRGFTFVELLIALAINMILFVAIVGMLLSNLNHYNQSLKINRLNQELQSILNLMSNDIRRAGYWVNASNDVGTGQNNNPFVASGVDISIPNSSCILFAYDHDNNGTLASISSSVDDERYGFRLNSQAIQARPPGAAFDCNAIATAWENMTDTNIIQITNLTFTLTTNTITTGPGTQGISMRSVDVTITGRLASDNTITKTLTQHIRIRNDKFIT
jgi:prepilin peptidase dependent protein B